MRSETTHQIIMILFKRKSGVCFEPIFDSISQWKLFELFIFLNNCKYIPTWLHKDVLFFILVTNY
jgi:hypothetical protein